MESLNLDLFLCLSAVGEGQGASVSTRQHYRNLRREEDVNTDQRPRTFVSTPSIYKITNSANGKIYVGSASDTSRRIIYHQNMLRKGKHTNRHLQRAFKKYGEEYFSFDVIEYVDDPQHLRCREQFWMDALRVCERDYGYNIVPDSQHKMMSPETRELLKNRPARKGWKHTEELKKRLSAIAKERHRLEGKTPKVKFCTGIKGNHLVGDMNPARHPEVRKKISAALMGHPVSEETRRKFREARRGVPNPKKRKTTRAQREEIISLRESGMTFVALGKMFGVSRVTIRHIVNRRFYRDDYPLI
jgi:group I intron endonuclease